MAILSTTFELVRFLIGKREMGPNDCSPSGKVVTPDDETNLPDGACRGLYIGVAGNLTVIHIDGGTCDYPNHPVGYAPLSVVRVLATGTTASGIRALY